MEGVRSQEVWGGFKEEVAFKAVTLTQKSAERRECGSGVLHVIKAIGGNT